MLQDHKDTWVNKMENISRVFQEQKKKQTNKKKTHTHTHEEVAFHNSIQD